jgi:lysophospholipase
MIKYQEVIHDLVSAGYSVYILDHRGQGFSERIALDQVGHVDRFNDYVDDLKMFIDRVVRPSRDRIRTLGGGGPLPLFLLAHSMGGCIASLYLETYPDDFDAAVLCSPMHRPSTTDLPEDIVKYAEEIIKHLIDTKNVLGKEKEFAPKKGPYLDEPYERLDPKTKALTHSKDRFEWVRSLYKRCPEVTVGGPSNQWVVEAIRAAKRAREDAGRIKIPVLLLQAGEDAIVEPDGQRIFQKNLGPGRCKLVPIAGAYHELLIECDEYRNRVLQEILAFLRDPEAALRAGR